MAKRIASRVALVTLVGSLMFFVFACGGSDTVPDDPTGADAAPQDQSVVLYQYRFNPNSLEIESGTTVVFENRDPETHNINIPALDVDTTVEPNEEWSHTFETQGEFAVGNRFSDGMMLDLVVD